MGSQVLQNFHMDCEVAINDLVNMELCANYVYLSGAYFFDRDDVALYHFKTFSKNQSDEKLKHAQKFLKYLNKRGGHIVLRDIKEVLDEIIDLDSINFVSTSVLAVLKAMGSTPCTLRIEIGREPPEVKTELIILLKLSEDRKKYLMASVMDQEKVGDIELINEETVNEDVEILIRLWTNRELEFKQKELKLKKMCLEVNQRYREDLEVIREKTENLLKKAKQYETTTTENMEPKEEEETTKEKLLGPDDSPSMPESKKEQQHQQQERVIVEEEEEISRDKPAVTGVEKKRSKFRNIKGFFCWNFCCFKNREQPKKVYKLEDCGQKLLDSADRPFGTPMQLISEWTETQVGMWLSGFGMKRYMMEFESKNIRGENLLTLDTNQLKCLGVNKRKHRKKIFKRIERLQMVEDAMMNFNNEIYNREKIYGKYDKQKNRISNVIFYF